MKHKICLLILIIIMIFPIVTYARYFEQTEIIKGKAIIAEPIFKLEKLQDTIIQTITKESTIKEYIFKVKNYELENDGVSKRISQVDMIYHIEVINEKTNFPVKCELYEIDGEENLLQENKKTQEFIMNKDIEYEKTYKLVAIWNDKEGILDSNDNIKILINSSQKK